MIYMTLFSQGAEKKHAAEHEAGMRLLQYALREEYGIDKMPEIAKGAFGKPYFPEYQNIQFNISHSSDRVVCALGQMELGVDIEHKRELKDNLIKRTLTENEKAWLEQSKDKKIAFIRLWTLKESYIKTTGEGLRTDLGTVEFMLPENCGRGEIICNQNGYAFYQKELSEDSYLSLCVKGDSVPEDMKKLHIVFL